MPLELQMLRARHVRKVIRLSTWDPGHALLVQREVSRMLMMTHASLAQLAHSLLLEGPIHVHLARKAHTLLWEVPLSVSNVGLEGARAMKAPGNVQLVQKAATIQLLELYPALIVRRARRLRHPELHPA